MENIQVPAEIGVLPLRNSVLFPHAIMPISVGRRKTLNLLDDVVRDNKLIGVVSQRNPSEDDPDPAGMYRVGTAARILKVVKLNGNNVNLIIQGLSRLRVDRFTASEPFIKAAVTTLDESSELGVELEALVKTLINQFQRLVQVSPTISNDLGDMVLSAGSGDPSRLSDLAASVLNIAVEEKIGLRERNNVKDRIQKLVEIITREVELQEISRRVGSRIRQADTFARLGGDEFVVIMDSLREDEDARLVAETILRTIEEIDLFAAQGLRISASVGVACGSGRREIPDLL